MRFRKACSLVLLATACSAAPPSAPANRPTASSPSSERPSTQRSPEPRPQTPTASGACPALDVALPELDRIPLDPPVPPLQDFSEHGSLDAFYQKLAAIARGRASEPIRIGFWGDSNLTRDQISGELRRSLQARFGDAGHGFIAVGQPWSWYLHMDVRHEIDDGWASYNLTTDQVADRFYGVGGIVAQNTAPRAAAWIATAPDGSPVGQRASMIEVLYLRHPKFGTFRASIDKAPPETIDTRAQGVAAALWRRQLPDGAHRIDLTASDDVAHPVRLLGVVLERAAPGVVVDSLGIGGVNMQMFARANPQILSETLRMRRYDLVMLLTGSTEPDLGTHDAAAKTFIERVQAALPGVPFMMMSPIDLAGGTVDRPTRSIRINQIERRKLRVARELGLIYWDFRGAMGGEQSIVRFAQHKLAWTDLIHLSEKGGRAMGRRLAYALIADFQRWLAEHPRAGC